MSDNIEALEAKLQEAKAEAWLFLNERIQRHETIWNSEANGVVLAACIKHVQKLNEMGSHEAKIATLAAYEDWLLLDCAIADTHPLSRCVEDRDTVWQAGFTDGFDLGYDAAGDDMLDGDIRAFGMFRKGEVSPESLEIIREFVTWWAKDDDWDDVEATPAS